MSFRSSFLARCLATCFYLAAMAGAAGDGPSWPPAERRGPASDAVLAEALTIVQQQALFLIDGERIDRTEIDTLKKLKLFLTSQDFFSDYLTQVQFEKLTQTQKPSYAGIGMEIQKTPAGEILCYPLPSSPAARAGIKAGDRLLAIDGLEARGQSLPTIVGIAVGKTNTMVRLDVATSGSGARRLQLRRAEIAAPAVSRDSRNGLVVIRVPSFTHNTKSDLEFIFSTLPPMVAAVIDLRSNTGGDLYSSIDSAMLFLEPGAPIVSVRGRRGVVPYVNTRDRPVITRPLVLWQDELTASAAEVFVAALTENHRAKAVGTKSFGKGTRQDVIELSNGGALILTTGLLQTPSGNEFDRQGLPPDIEVMARGGTEEYLRKTLPLLATHRSSQRSRASS